MRVLNDGARDDANMSYDPCECHCGNAHSAGRTVRAYRASRL